MLSCLKVVAVQERNLSVFEVEVLDEVGVDPPDLGHEVEGLVEVLLPQALVLDELQEVGALDVALQPNHTCDRFDLPFTLLEQNIIMSFISEPIQLKALSLVRTHPCER